MSLSTLVTKAGACSACSASSAASLVTAHSTSATSFYRPVPMTLRFVVQFSSSYPASDVGPCGRLFLLLLFFFPFLVFFFSFFLIGSSQYGHVRLAARLNEIFNYRRDWLARRLGSRTQRRRWHCWMNCRGCSTLVLRLLEI